MKFELTFVMLAPACSVKLDLVEAKKGEKANTEAHGVWLLLYLERSLVVLEHMVFDHVI